MGGSWDTFDDRQLYGVPHQPAAPLHEPRPTCSEDGCLRGVYMDGRCKRHGEEESYRQESAKRRGERVA